MGVGHPLLVRRTVGTQLEGHVTGQLPSGAWRIQCEAVGADLFVLLRDRKPRPRAKGERGRFWVIDVDVAKATLLVTDDPFGFVPISDGMRARYRLALAAGVALLETRARGPDLLAQLSELKGMFNRCLRRDQRDWAAVFALLGYPEEAALLRGVALVTELRRALVAEAETEVTAALEAADRDGLHPLLEQALALLDTDRARLPRARQVVRAERLPPPAALPARTMVEVDLNKVRRAAAEHEQTLQTLRAYLKAAGYVVETNVHVDAFARLRTGPAIFEVKSIHAENETAQLREALSQLYEYRYRYAKEAALWVVLCRPLSPAAAWMQAYLQEDRDVGLLWCEEGGALAGDWLPRLTETLHAQSLRKQVLR